MLPRRLSTLLTTAGAAWSLLAMPALADNPSRIDGYVTPYYDASGPAIRIGRYSAGLASKSRPLFVATIRLMKKNSKQLTFAQLYVAAIRLYDLGYRDEATYWFYSAQYRGRQFMLLVDRAKMGGMGSSAFELYHAAEAFFEVAGPDINGFAFKNIDAVVAIVRRVQRENRSVADVTRLYPGVAFLSRSQWPRLNSGLGAGLAAMAAQLTSQKSSIAAQRAQNGTAARFAPLTSTPFPGGL